MIDTNTFIARVGKLQWMLSDESALETVRLLELTDRNYDVAFKLPFNPASSEFVITNS